MGLADPLDSASANGFRFILDGIEVPKVIEVSGLASEVDKIEMKQQTKDGKYIVRNLIGRPKAGQITVTRGLTDSKSITASVPFTAPATPPDTGASMAVMPRVPSAAAIDFATRGPVVERSTKVLTREPDAIPPSPSTTSSTTAGTGRLVITISARDATSCAEDAVAAPLLAMADSACPWMS